MAMTFHSRRTLEIALGALEALEYPGLVWGMVDAFVTEEQLLEAIGEAFDKADIADNPADAVEELEDRLLVRYWMGDGARCYRSRFAELVRLTTRLRQLFDRRAWRSAPSLVSDYRLDISPRRYPIRNTVPSDALAELESAGIVFSDLQRAIWEKILESGGIAALSRFQIDAVKRIFCAGPKAGSIITAGTGTGKTLAFYLPAFLVAAERATKSSSFTKIVSIYPRNELLKDQLTEVYKLARAANAALLAAGKPAFRVGALFGQVPLTPDTRAVKEFSKWHRKGDGYLCPILRCPDCGSETIWKAEDLEKGVERVYCVACGFKSNPKELCLTRASIQKAPPDFLFTSTEMLNQRMSDTWMRHIFGIGVRPDRAPSFVLLDEVHTYVSAAGAQTALLLRRWQWMMTGAAHWTGLSATLEDASQFFADLTGLYESNIQEVTPNEADLEEEGADYQILVRSDPASQTAVLSTSIQSLMLLARMMDPDAGETSGGLFGGRVFAFTDNLDVINRLFDNLRDAEAYLPWGQVDTSRDPLAQLRARERPEPTERDYDGQLWSLAEDLRQNLAQPLTIGRTTSRDPGVLESADVIVATASLEVGFNDPNVGAILQHKAPHAYASFVQRKGRAGRRRGMRPIMMTVLSDYGRDRLAFQNYEYLFSPRIERQRLPIRNGYVLRIQAAAVLLDWISQLAVRQGKNGWSWKALSWPTNDRRDADFLGVAKEVVRDLVRLDPKRIEALKHFLRGSLKIDDRTLDLILWEQPRALLLETLPTLARRLFTDWELVRDKGQLDYHVKYHPLPDFVPRQLFGELNLPEVAISVPPGSKYSDERQETARIHRALTEFVPGRVSRRFAEEIGNIAHWFPLDHEQDRQTVLIGDYLERSEYLGTYEAGAEKPARVYRPLAMRTQNLSAKQPIGHTSTGFWNWNSEFAIHGDAHDVDLSNAAAWSSYLPKLEFYLHRLGGAITVRRFANSGVSTLMVNGQSKRIEFDLRNKAAGDPAAIGFAYESDGIRIPLRLPNQALLSNLELSRGLARWLDIVRFRDLVRNDQTIPKALNSFRRDWLSQIVLHAAVRLAETSQTTLRESFQKIGGYDAADLLRPSISALVGGEIVEEGMETDQGALERTIEEDLEQDGVLARICNIATDAFWAELPAKIEWIRQLFAYTLSEAVLQACVIATPSNTALEGLSVDLQFDDGAEGDTVSIIIVESTLGGGGTIEALAEAFSQDPRAFHKALEAALAPSDAEIASRGLCRIIDEVTTDGPCAEALNVLRGARSVKEREASRIAFARQLGQRGIQYSRSLAVSFATRFLRADASPRTDRLARDLLASWYRLEEKHDICLPLRTFTALADIDPAIREGLVAAGGEGRELATAERLLWAREGELRQFAIQSYNPYRDAWVSDAGFIREMIVAEPIETVLLDSKGWPNTLRQVLARSGIAAVRCSGEMGATTASLLEAIAQPISVGYNYFYPVIDAYRENDDGISEIVVVLREMF